MEKCDHIIMIRVCDDSHGISIRKVVIISFVSEKV